jgi:uracil phosphoribosyltransferase
VNPIVLDHPLVHRDLARLRDRSTGTEEFRRATSRIATALVLEATRRLPTRTVAVDGPLEASTGRTLAGDVTFVPILRAGLGMLDAALALLPGAGVGVLGIRRDETTREPHRYLVRLPRDIAHTRVFVLDPMLATGGTAEHAAALLAESGCRDVSLLCLVAAPEGVARLARAHPSVAVWTAALDRALDPDAFIRPGLGDAGDRLFGTPEG